MIVLPRFNCLSSTVSDKLGVLTFDRGLFVRFLPFPRANGLGLSVLYSARTSRPFNRVRGLRQEARIGDVGLSSISRRSNVRRRATNFKCRRRVTCGLEVHRDGEPTFLSLLRGWESRQAVQPRRVSRAYHSRSYVAFGPSFFRDLVRALRVCFTGPFKTPRCVNQVRHLVNESRCGLLHSMLGHRIYRGAHSVRVVVRTPFQVILRRQRVFVNNDVGRRIQAILLGGLLRALHVACVTRLGGQLCSQGNSYRWRVRFIRQDFDLVCRRRPFQVVRYCLLNCLPACATNDSNGRRPFTVGRIPRHFCVGLCSIT